MEKYHLYILQSMKDRSYYVGETSNIEYRLEFHNKGLQRYTRNKRPWALVYSEEFSRRIDALEREREIKRKKSRKYIEWLVSK